MGRDKPTWIINFEDCDDGPVEPEEPLTPEEVEAFEAWLEQALKTEEKSLPHHFWSKDVH